MFSLSKVINWKTLNRRLVALSSSYVLTTLFFVLSSVAQQPFQDDKGESSVFLDKGGFAQINIADPSIRLGYLFNKTDDPWIFGFNLSGKLNGNKAGILNNGKSVPDAKFSFSIGYDFSNKKAVGEREIISTCLTYNELKKDLKNDGTLGAEYEELPKPIDKETFREYLLRIHKGEDPKLSLSNISLKTLEEKIYGAPDLRDLKDDSLVTPALKEKIEKFLYDVDYLDKSKETLPQPQLGDTFRKYVDNFRSEHVKNFSVEKVYKTLPCENNEDKSNKHWRKHDFTTDELLSIIRGFEQSDKTELRNDNSKIDKSKDLQNYLYNIKILKTAENLPLPKESEKFSAYISRVQVELNKPIANTKFLNSSEFKDSSILYKRLTFQGGYAFQQFTLSDSAASFDKQVYKKNFHSPSAQLIFSQQSSPRILWGASLGIDRANNSGDLTEVEVRDINSTINNGTTREVGRIRKALRGDFKQSTRIFTNQDLVWFPKSLGSRLALDFFSRIGITGNSRGVRPGIGLFYTKEGAPTHVIGGVNISYFKGKANVGLVAGFNF